MGRSTMHFPTSRICAHCGILDEGFTEFKGQGPSAGSARIATSSGTSLLLDVGACIGSYKYIGSYRYIWSGHIVYRTGWPKERIVFRHPPHGMPSVTKLRPSSKETIFMALPAVQVLRAAVTLVSMPAFQDLLSSLRDKCTSFLAVPRPIV